MSFASKAAKEDGAAAAPAATTGCVCCANFASISAKEDTTAGAAGFFGFVVAFSSASSSGFGGGVFFNKSFKDPMMPFFFVGGGGFVCCCCCCCCCCSANAFCSSNLICSMAPSGLPGAVEFDAANTPLPRPADFEKPFSPGNVGCRFATATGTGFGFSACFLTFSDPPFQFKFITSSKLMFSTFLTTSGAALPKLGIAGGCDKFTTEDTAIIAPLQSGSAPLKSLPPTNVPSNIISTCSATMCVVCASVYP